MTERTRKDAETSTDAEARELYRRGGVEVLNETVERLPASPVEPFEGGSAAIVAGDYRVEGARLAFDSRSVLEDEQLPFRCSKCQTHRGAKDRNPGMCVHRRAVLTHLDAREERINRPPSGSLTMLHYPALRRLKNPPWSRWVLFAAEPTPAAAHARTRREDFRELLEAERLRHAHANARRTARGPQPGENASFEEILGVAEFEEERERIDAEYAETGSVPGGEEFVSVTVIRSADLYEMVTPNPDETDHLGRIDDDLHAVRGYSARGTEVMFYIEALASELGCVLPDLGKNLARFLLDLGVHGRGVEACRCVGGLSLAEPAPDERLPALPYLGSGIFEDGEHLPSTQGERA